MLFLLLYLYNPDPVTGTITTPIIEEINIIVLALGLTKPGTWNRAHVLPRLR
jgi:hypothetical protein